MQAMEPEAAITFREVISGTVLTLLALFILPGEGIEPAHLLAGAAQAHILWLAGALAGFSYLFYYRANHRLGCARGMATNATYIIWGVALNVCFSGAALQPFELLGCGLVFAGVLLTAFCQAEA
jgi:drug/metabolite transporter (DMT)-like permease